MLDALAAEALAKLSDFTPQACSLQADASMTKVHKDVD